MSKEQPGQQVSWGNGYAVSADTPDRLMGRLSEVIEVIGLPEGQLKASKALISKTIWEIFGSGVSISSKRYTEIRQAELDEQSLAEENNTPMRAV